MAAPHSTVVLIATILVFATSISAKDYVVGDDSGWTLDFDYQDWAKDKVFFVGDNLVFNYASGIHNVMKVNGTSFQECIVSSANEVLTSGRDVIPLKTPGRKWYICGIGKHCVSRNIKLVITVLPDPKDAAPIPIANSASTKFAVYGFVAAFFNGFLLLFV